MVKLLDLVLGKPAGQRVIISDEIRSLLGDLSVVEGPDPFGSGALRGIVQLEVNHTLFGFASLDLSNDLSPKIDFELTDLGSSVTPDGFRADLIVLEPNNIL